MTTLQTLYETLAQYFFPYRNEDELQRGIEAALTHKTWLHRAYKFFRNNTARFGLVRMAA